MHTYAFLDTHMHTYAYMGMYIYARQGWGRPSHYFARKTWKSIIFDTVLNGTDTDLKETQLKRLINNLKCLIILIFNLKLHLILKFNDLIKNV